MDMRQQFEAWISAPPYEGRVQRYSHDEKTTAYPGQYRHYPVQVAWEAWQAATKAEREACADVCEEVAVSSGDPYYVAGAETSAAAIRARDTTQGDGNVT